MTGGVTGGDVTVWAVREAAPEDIDEELADLGLQELVRPYRE